MHNSTGNQHAVDSWYPPDRIAATPRRNLSDIRVDLHKHHIANSMDHCHPQEMVTSRSHAPTIPLTFSKSPEKISRSNFRERWNEV